MSKITLKKRSLYIISSVILIASIAIVILSPNYFNKSDSKSIDKIGYFQFHPSKFSKNNEIAAIAWGSNEGIQRFQNSKYKNDFFQLVNFFQPQINPLYCGIASSVIILNAMKASKGEAQSQKAIEVSKPEIIGGGVIPFKSYSQITLLNEKTDKIKSRKIINLENSPTTKTEIDPGLKLKELSEILTIYGINNEINYAVNVSDENINQFRELLKETLQDNDNYIIANFHGRSFGSKTGGHISPLVAYHQDSDSVLIMDVGGHKNPWYWVKIDHLYKAMNLKDGDTHRGYLIIS